MKETEEETWKRVCIEETGYYLIGDEKYHLLAHKYLSERLKFSLPSEQEIEALANKKVGYIHDTVVTDTYKQGFKDALTLLTKGDR